MDFHRNEMGLTSVLFAGNTLQINLGENVVCLEPQNTDINVNSLQSTTWGKTGNKNRTGLKNTQLMINQKKIGWIIVAINVGRERY